MTTNQVGASARRTRAVTRDDKPVTTLATSITNQDDVLVLDGTAVVWRDPVVSAATAPATHPHAGSPAPTQEKIA